MTAELLAPAALALLAGVCTGRLRHRLPPRLGVVVFTALAVAAAVGVSGALALVVVGALAGNEEVVARLAWCGVAIGHGAPPALAAAAGALLMLGAARVVRFELRWRRALRRYSDSGDGGDNDGGVTVLPLRRPVAYARPGGAGEIVVSQGLLDALDDAGRAALFAHESCHLSRGHHRFLHLSGAAAAVVPMLAPLDRHVRYATEREADEAAARAVGDRVAVARAIATAALSAHEPSPLLAAGGHGVPRRVDELLHPKRRSLVPEAAVLAALAALVTVVASSTVQVHHLVAFALHVCGLG